MPGHSWNIAFQVILAYSILMMMGRAYSPRLDSSKCAFMYVVITQSGNRNAL